MSQYTQTILAGDSFDFGGGNRFQIIESDNDVQVEVFKGSQLIEKAESVSDSYYQEPERKPGGLAFDTVRITATVDTIISVEISKGKGGSNAIGGSVAVSGAVDVTPSSGLSTFADLVLVSGVTTLLLSAGATRKEAIISNLSTNGVPIRVGDGSTGVAGGVEVLPGQTLVLETGAAVYAYALGTPAIARSEVTA